MSLLLLAGCTTPILVPPGTPTPAEIGIWQPIAAGVQVISAADGLIALRHGPGRVTYTAQFEPNPNQARNVGRWLADSVTAVAAMNCGFYLQEEERYQHIGLLMADGEVLEKLRPRWGGVLIVRRGIAAITRRPQRLLGPGTLGIQGWPTLVWQAATVAGLDASIADRRTAVGIDDRGRIVWVVSPSPLSLDEFGQRLLQPDLNLIDAINLDGGVSTGLRWRDLESGDQHGPNNLPTPCAILISPP